MQLGTENAVGHGHCVRKDTSADINIDDLLADLEDVADTPTETEKRMDAASLREHQHALNEELKSAMLEGNAADVIRLQNLLRELPARIIAADSAEIRQGIDNATERLAQVEQEIDYVTEIRKANNKTLAEIIQQAEPVQLAIRKNDFAIEVLKMERTSLHEARRDYRLRLEQIIDDAASASGGKQI